MTNKPNGILYIGVTNDLIRRVALHKQEIVEGFTKKYHLHKLVFYEQYVNISEAIAREKQLKNWHRDWKINLITSQNPQWRDLFEELLDPETSSG